MLQTLDIIQTVLGQTSYIKLRILSDFVHQTSLWTLDISFQTLDCGLRTYFRRRILAFIVRLRTDVKLRTQKLGQFICHTTKTNIHMLPNKLKKNIIIYIMRIRRPALRSMVIAIMQTTSDSFQTSDRLQTNFGLTSDVRLLLQTLDLARHRTSDFGFWTSDFEFHTSDLGLRISDIRFRTLNFRVQILDFDYRTTSDRPRPSDFEFRSLDFKLWTILQISLELNSSDFGLQTSDFKIQS